MNNLVKFIFVSILVSSCVQEEQTPDNLFLGKYRLYEKESLELLNDSLMVMHLKINKKKYFDTLIYEYSPPIQNEKITSAGDIFIKSKINQNSELYRYCKTMNYDETHLFYIIRYGQNMMLPNPESTELSYVLKNEN